MTNPRSLRRFLADLKERNVYRVAVSYLVAAFVVVQVADLAVGAFGLPDGFEPMVWVVCGLGLPVALILAWAYDLGPHGPRRNAAGEGSEPLAEVGTVRRIPNPIWLALVAAGGIVGWFLMNASSSGITDRSIAVLPFEATGGDESLEFSRGLHDGLLTRLTNVAALTVTSSTSTRRYQSTELAVPEIATQLGVAWIVEGAVFLAGDQIRVNATLIDARQDDRLWSRDYERDVTLENVFDIQSDLAQDIARSLETELSSRERNRLTSRPTDDLDAYRSYIQGRTALERRTEPALRQAVDYFEAALERDETFAEAWSGLADARIILAGFAFDRSDTLPGLAHDAALRAVALDADLGEAHASLGYVLNLHREDGPAAHAELTRAIELNPNLGYAYYWLSTLETQRGAFDEALALIETAAEVDPLSPGIHNVVGLQRWAVTGPDSALLAHFERSRSLEPGYPLPYINGGLLLSELGEVEEGLELAARGLELSAEGTFTWGFALGVLGAIHAAAGDLPGARSTVERLRAHGGYPFSEAMVHAALGGVDQAFVALGEVEWTAYLHWDLQAHATMRPLQGDPRYRRLVEEVNRRWGLGPDGSLPD